MPSITVKNQTLGTSTQVYLPDNGILTKQTRRRVRRRLGTPPGFPGAGPLGEEGPQQPPEMPGWEYQFLELEDGRVRAVPHPVMQEAVR